MNHDFICIYANHDERWTIDPSLIMNRSYDTSTYKWNDSKTAGPLQGPFSLGYGANGKSLVEEQAVTDSISIGSTTLSNVSIGIATVDTAGLLKDKPYVGVLGLGPELLAKGTTGSIESAFSGLDIPLVAFNFKDRSTGNATLQIGGIDDQAYDGRLASAPLVSNLGGYWAVGGVSFLVKGTHYSENTTMIIGTWLTFKFWSSILG